MRKIRNYLLDRWLKKDGLIPVPSSWAKEYKELYELYEERQEDYLILASEYNNLLETYLKSLKSIVELQDFLVSEKVSEAVLCNTVEELQEKGFKALRIVID